MPYGPSHCSITPEAPRRLDRLEFGEIEFDNRPQSVGERTVLLVVRQRFQPTGVFGLQLHGGGDRVVSALDPAGRAADANDWCTSRVCGAIACLTFGAGHGLFIDQ
jgi:hypothetical protein